MIHAIYVTGRPKPKERPRVYRGRAFTPTATIDYEKRIAKAWSDKYGDLMLEGKLVVHVDVTSRYADRADVDNYLKTALDGLQGSAFQNDSAVIAAKVTKAKVTAEDDEGMRIAIFQPDDVVSSSFRDTVTPLPQP